MPGGTARGKKALEEKGKSRTEGDIVFLQFDAVQRGERRPGKKKKKGGGERGEEIGLRVSFLLIHKFAESVKNLRGGEKGAERERGGERKCAIRSSPKEGRE